MFLTKDECVRLHEGEFEQWQALLQGMSTERLTQPWLPDGWSVKDVLAHLRAWQTRTVARLEAAIKGGAPRFPEWPVDIDADESDEAVEKANAWIFEANRARPWEDVHGEWAKTFTRLLELMRQLPEAEVRPGGRLAWLVEYEPLREAPEEYDYHHAEHRVWLQRSIREAGERGT